MFKRAMVSMLLLFGLVAGAQATLLGLTLEDTPDIVSAFIDINYDAGSNALTADGFALQIEAMAALGRLGKHPSCRRGRIEASIPPWLGLVDGYR